MRSLPPVPKQEKHPLARFSRDEEGTTAVEYAIIAGGIMLAIVGAIAALGGNLQAIYDKLPTLF